MKGGPSLFGYSYSILHFVYFRSEERRKKKKWKWGDGRKTISSPGLFPQKMGPTHFLREKPWGRGWKKMLSPAPLSVRLEETEGTPYEQLPYYWTNQRFLRSVEVPYLIYIYVVWQDVLRSRAHEGKVWNTRESTLSGLTGRNAYFTTIPNCLSIDGQTERLADFWMKILIKYLI